MLDSDTFVAEVRKRRPKDSGKLTPAGLTSLREAWADTEPGVQLRRAEMQQLEGELSRLVNRAYGLTPGEEALLWRTAPPRMPIPPPAAETP